MVSDIECHVKDQLCNYHHNLIFKFSGGKYVSKLFIVVTCAFISNTVITNTCTCITNKVCTLPSGSIGHLEKRKAGLDHTKRNKKKP